jgi:hypothetical protein
LLSQLWAIQRTSFLNWSCTRKPKCYSLMSSVWMVLCHCTCQLWMWFQSLSMTTGVRHGEYGQSRIRFWIWTWFMRTELQKRCMCLIKMASGEMMVSTMSRSLWTKLLMRPIGMTSSQSTISDTLI